MRIPPPFKPSPHATRWALSSLERAEAEARGETPPPPRGADEVFLNVREVAARYGVSVPTVWRQVQATRRRQRAGNSTTEAA